MTAVASTNIADLRNAPAVRQQHNVVAGFNDMQSFELLQRVGKMLAASTLVPEVYRGAEGLPNAIVALNMAQRMGADPLMVMQNLYVVHGRPAWSAQFLIATFNHSGRYTSIRYRWQGTEGKDDWGCRAYATEIASGNEITGPLVTMGLAKAEKWIERTGSKWKTIPELMLTYRAAAWMVRTNAPEIAMGLPTSDEIDDVVTLTPDQYSVAQMAEGEHARPAAKAQETSAGDPNAEQATTTSAAPAEPAAAVSAAPPTLTLAQLSDKFHQAAKKRDPDLLDAHATLIKELGDEQHRKEATALYHELRDSIAA